MEQGSDHRDLGLEPYRAAHRVLRGRYGLLLALGLIGGILGGWACYAIKKPVYRSEGVVRIAFATAASDSEVNQGRKMAIFQEFMRTQEQVMGSRRLMSMAVADSEWKMMGRGDSMEDAIQFAKHLSVEHVMGTEHLRIVFTDSDAAVAATGVGAAIRAYRTLYASQEFQEGAERLKVLQAKADELRAQLKSCGEELQRIDSEFGTTDISQLYQKKVEEVAKLDSELTDIRVALAAAAPQQSSAVEQELTVNQIGILDPHMRDYLNQQDSITSQLAAAKLRGALDGNGEVERLKQLSQIQQDRIEAYADEFRRFHKTHGDGPAVHDELAAQEAEVKKIYEGSRGDMIALGGKVNQIHDEQAKYDELDRNLKAISREIDDVQMEDELGGRLDVVSWGIVPTVPFQDSRMKFAMAGAMLGMLAPAALLLGFGLIGRRLRYADEADSFVKDVSLLGMLPLAVSQKPTDEERALIAHCTHQVRVMLQVKSRGRKSSVYLITSSCVGDGKTRLTRALGISFANSGARTLLIDSDLIGQGLSRRFGVNGPGFRESLEDGDLPALVRGTTCSNLFVVPSGMASFPETVSLSPGRIAQVLSQAREGFDVVLVDSGPLLGSIEASMVAAEADGVILVVSRGQPRSIVERTLAYVQAVKGKVEGVVFNRASTADVERAGYGPSQRSSSESVAILNHLPALEVEDPYPISVQGN
jgi:polysaccharide biosynthesis transport protein